MKINNGIIFQHIYTGSIPTRILWRSITLCLVVMTDIYISNGQAQQPTTAPRIKVLPVSAFGYTPETAWYAGAVSLFTLNFYQDSNTRVSNAKLDMENIFHFRNYTMPWSGAWDIQY